MFLCCFCQVFWRQSTKMVGLMFSLVVFSIPSVPQQCNRAVRSIKGMYLSGHVMSNGSADGVGDCLVDCSLHPRCKNINFRFKDLLCQLNEADRHTHPWNYRSRGGHAYSDYPFKVISPLRGVARDKLWLRQFPWKKKQQYLRAQVIMHSFRNGRNEQTTVIRLHTRLCLSVDLFILGQEWIFFGISLPLPAERLSWLYIHWFD